MEKGIEKERQILGTRVFLVRHGETDWNRTHRFQGRIDIPLNQDGKCQANALALALKEEFFTAIFSSPLLRAKETACLIKVFHPVTPLYEEEGLTEMDLGAFDGMEAKDWALQYQDFLETWRRAPASLKMPGGESLQEVQIRAVNTMERIARLYPVGSTLLLCGHNFVNRAILCHALGFPLDRFREVPQDTSALNMLTMHGERFWAEVVNDLAHLKKYENVFLQT